MVFPGSTAILSLERFRRAAREKQEASPKLSSRSSWGSACDVSTSANGSPKSCWKSGYFNETSEGSSDHSTSGNLMPQKPLEKTTFWPKALRGIRLLGRSHSSSQNAQNFAGSSKASLRAKEQIDPESCPRSKNWYEEGDRENTDDVYIDSHVHIPRDLHQQMMKSAEESVDRGQHRLVWRVSLEQISDGSATRSVRASTQSLVLNGVCKRSLPSPKSTVAAQIPSQNMPKSIASYLPTAPIDSLAHLLQAQHGQTFLARTHTDSCCSDFSTEHSDIFRKLDNNIANRLDVQFAELCHQAQQVPDLRVRQEEGLKMRL